MSRIINPDNAGKERRRLTRSVVLAVRQLAQQSEINNDTRDLAAFIALALIAISKTVEISITPWEKRGYWVKADRFRMEWTWAGIYGKSMARAVQADDWAGIPQIAAQIAQKLITITIPKRHRLGTPWTGAWKALQAHWE